MSKSDLQIEEVFHLQIDEFEDRRTTCRSKSPLQTEVPSGKIGITSEEDQSITGKLNKTL